MRLERSDHRLYMWPAWLCDMFLAVMYQAMNQHIGKTASCYITPIIYRGTTEMVNTTNITKAFKYTCLAIYFNFSHYIFSDRFLLRQSMM